jgi:hypothetical protein
MTRLLVKLAVLVIAAALALWLGLDGDLVTAGAALVGGLLALHP